MSANPKHRDLDGLRQRQDISRQEVDDLYARVTQHFLELGENATPAPPPDPSKFDPTREAYWELAMLIAYTMGASADQVRQVWTRYRREAQQPAGVKLLDLAVYCAIWKKFDGAELLSREEATQIIWKRAAHGELTGYGEPLDGAGKPEAIPLFHWPSLSLDDDRTGPLLRFRGGAGYRNVMFPNPSQTCKSTSEPSGPRADAALATISSVPTAAAESACREWLQGIMRPSPNVRTRSSDDLLKEAQKKYPRLSKRGYDRARIAAAEAACAPAWVTGGAPKKPPQ